jgi:predicted ribosomally synthesized peptide with nif11-like leader
MSMDGTEDKEIGGFLARLATDDSLREKVAELAKSPETLAAYLQENGYEFSLEELGAGLSHKGAGEATLSDQEMAGVAGGLSWPDIQRIIDAAVKTYGDIKEKPRKV